MLHDIFSRKFTKYICNERLHKFQYLSFTHPIVLYIIGNPKLSFIFYTLGILNYCVVTFSAGWCQWSGREAGHEVEERPHTLDPRSVKLVCHHLQVFRDAW